MNIGLWIVQGLLALQFLAAGVAKFVMSPEQMKGPALSPAFIHFIGVMEILGALGLILPSVFRIRPILTPLAALGLFIIMVGAVVLTVPMGMFIFPAIVGLLTAFVAYGRWRLAPLAPR